MDGESRDGSPHHYFIRHIFLNLLNYVEVESNI